MQRSRQFITGTTAYKSDTIAHHEKSQSHQLAAKLYKYSDTPEESPAVKAVQQLNQQHTAKLRILSRNAHALAKYRKPFQDYSWLCELDEAKGLAPGNTYRSDKACRTFTKYVSQAQKTLAKNSVDKAKFIAVTSDGSTDSGISEQELEFLRFCMRGIVTTQFVGFEVPVNPNAEGIYMAIKRALKKGLDLEDEDLKQKLVSFACDGAAVMVGKNNGVSALLQRHIKPSLITVHCFAHRLELSYKDSVKKVNLYDSVITLLMGLYYFYHKSPKQQQNLERSFVSLQQVPAFSTRVGGTRWVGHMVLAIETCLKSYKAIVNQLEDVAIQKVSKVNAAGKAHEYIKLLKRPDVMGYIHVVLDVLKPLRILSSTLQSNQTTLADVDEKIQMTVGVLKSYKDSPGPMTRSYLGETKDQLFKGVKLSGSVDVPNLAKLRVSLTNNLSNSFESRFADAKAGVVEATRIANFHTWPVHDKKEDISKFGCEEVKLITAHFKDVLVCANVNSNDALAEWDMLKSNLYSRYKVAVQKLLWTDVWQCYGDSYYNIPVWLILLEPCLPAQQRTREVFHKYSW